MIAHDSKILMKFLLQILPWFASIAPKMNEFFSKRIDLIKKKIGKLDDGAQKYLREVRSIATYFGNHEA